MGAHGRHREGVLFITLRKSEALFSPTTRYRDLALGPSLFHWESQSSAGRARSPSRLCASGLPGTRATKASGRWRGAFSGGGGGSGSSRRGGCRLGQRSGWHEYLHRVNMDEDGIEVHRMVGDVCAADGALLEPVGGGAGVWRCPNCGHRTDEPGEGLLGDGFDVNHRQWSLRGDLHAWRAMRDLVGATPTPNDREAVRAAYVDALRRVADVDIDQTDERVVHRPHLDHGGMSGGSVDVEWWRSKGIPLLVERAVQRRPALVSPSARRPGGRVIDIIVWTILLVIPAALVGGGGFLLVQRAVGTRVEAKVLECNTSGAIIRGASTYRTECIAQWEIGGRLVIGGFTGGNGESDVGSTVDATVRGDIAYSRSLGLPVMLIAMGLPFLALPVLAIRRRVRSRVS